MKKPIQQSPGQTQQRQRAEDQVDPPDHAIVDAQPQAEGVHQVGDQQRQRNLREIAAAALANQQPRRIEGDQRARPQQRHRCPDCPETLSAPRPHNDDQRLEGQQKDGEVVCRQCQQGDDPEADRSRALRFCPSGGAQQQIDADCCHRRPQRIGTRFLAEPEQKGTGRCQQCGKPGRCWRGKAPPRAPARQRPDRRDEERRRQRRRVAHCKLTGAGARHDGALHQKVKERVLVDGQQSADAVADPQCAAQQVSQRLFDALHAQALVPPQRLEVEQQDTAQIG